MRFVGSYPRDLHYHAVQAFKIKLREKVVATYEASKTPQYTTFLKHFGQFVVAQLDEKKVGKEDYLLAALSELRSEVQMLSKAVRAKEGEIPTGFAQILANSKGLSNPTKGLLTKGLLDDEIRLVTEKQRKQLEEMNSTFADLAIAKGLTKKPNL